MKSIKKILEIEAKLASNLHNPEEPVYIKIKEEFRIISHGERSHREFYSR